MAGKPIDERIIKISLDVSDVEKKGSGVTKKISSLFDNLKNAFKKVDTTGAQNAMNKFSSAVDNTANKTRGILGKLRDTFSKAFGKIDVGRPIESIKRMNTNLQNSVNQSGSILGRLKSIFSKNSISGDGFEQAGSSAQKMSSTITNALSSLTGSIFKVDATPISNSFSSTASSVQSSISLMDIALGTFMGNLATKGASAVMNFMGNFTNGMRDGFGEFETKMGSVQTILANTKRHGTTLKDVNQTLEELNTYSDETIYNFGDMTSAISRFTTTGMDLKTSTTAIKGMANAAALTGASASDLSRAYYQVSQAMSSGVIRLQDWVSIGNANIESLELKEKLIEIGKAYGTITDDMEVTTENFRDTLTEGKWLTAEVWAAAMAEYADETTELGRRASIAARQVKTFSHMVDTIQEDIGSGWAKTWEYIFGDFDQGVKLWTGIKDQVSGIIGIFAEARNSIFMKWNKGGGFEAFWGGVQNIINSVAGIFKSLSTAMGRVFGTGDGVANVMIKISQAFQKVTSYIQPGKEGFEVLIEIFTLLFSVVKIGMKIVGAFIKIAMVPLKAVAMIAGAGLRILVGAVELLTRGVNFLLNPIVKLADYLSGVLSDAMQQVSNYITGILVRAFDKLTKVWNKIVEYAKLFVNWLNMIDQKFQITSTIVKTISSIITTALNVIKVTILGLIAIAIKPFVVIWETVSKSISGVVGVIKSAGSSISQLQDKFKSAFTTFTHMSGLSAHIHKVKSSFKSMKEAIMNGDWDKLTESFKNLKDGIKQTWSSITSSAKKAMDSVKATKVYKDLYDNAMKHMKPTIDLYNKYKDKVVETYDNIKNKSKELYENHLKSHVDKFSSHITSVFNSKINPTLQKYGDLAKSKLSKLGFDFEAFDKIKQSFNDLFNNQDFKLMSEILGNNMKSLFSAFAHGNLDAVKNNLTGIYNILKWFTGNIWKEIKNGFSEAFHFGPLQEKIYQGWKNLVFRIKMMFKKLNIDLSSWDAIKRSFDKMKEVLGKAIEELKKKFSGLKDIKLDKIKQEWDKISKAANEVIRNLKEWNLEGVVESFKKFSGMFEGSPLHKFFLAIIGTGFAAYAIAIFNAIRKWSGLLKSLTKFVDMMKDVGEAASEVPKGLKSATKAFKLLQATLVVASILAIAGAVRLMADAFKVLGDLSNEQIIQGAKAITIIMTELVAATYLASKAEPSLNSVLQVVAVAFAIKMIANVMIDIGKQSPSSVKLGMATVSTIMLAMGLTIKLMNSHAKEVRPTGALTLISLALSVMLLGKVIKQIGEMDRGTLANGGLVVTAIMGVMGLCVKLMNSGNHSSKGNAAAMIAMGVSVYLIGKTIERIGKMDLMTISKGGLVISALMMVMGLSIKLMNTGKGNVGSSAKNAINLIALAMAVNMLAKSVVKLGSISVKDLLKGTLAVSKLGGLLTALLRVMPNKQKAPSLKSVFLMIAYAGTIYALATAVGILGLIPKNVLDKGLITITYLSTIIAAMIYVINQSATSNSNGLKSAATIAAIALAINLLVPPITLLGSMDLKTVAQGLLVVSGALLAIGLAVKLMNSGKGGTGGVLQLVAIAGVILVLSQAMVVLGSIPLNQIVTGLIALTSALGVLLGAAYIAGLGPVSNGLMSLSITLGALGVALIGAAALITSVVLAFNTFANATDEQTKNIVNQLTIFMQELAAKSFEIGKAAAEILTKFIAGLATGIPAIIPMAVEMIVAILTGLAQGMPQIITAAVELIIAFAKGIIDNLPKLVDTAVQLVVSFLDSLLKALTEHVPKLIPSIAKFLTTMFKGAVDLFVQTVGPILQIIGDAFKGLLEVLGPIVTQIAGFFTRIVEAIAPVISDIANAVGKIVECFTRMFEQISPILDSIAKVIKETGGAIKNALDGVSGVIDSIGGAIKGFFDGIAGVVKSFGESAHEAGKGVKKMAEGIERLTNLNLLDIIGTMGAVVGYVKDLSSQGSGMKTAAQGIREIGDALTKIQSASGGAGMSLTVVTLALQKMTDTIPQLPLRFSQLATGLHNVTTYASNLAPALSLMVPAMALLATTTGSVNSVLTTTVGLFTGFATVTTVLSSAFGNFTTIVTNLGVALVTANTGFNTLLTTMSQLGNVTLTIVTQFTSIQNVITQLSSSTNQLTAGLGLLSGAIGMFTFALGASSGALGVFKSLIVPLAPAVNLINTALLAVNTTFNSMATSLNTVGVALSNVVSKLPSLTTGFISVNATISSTMNTIQTSITNTFNSAVNTISNGINRMISAINSGVSTIRNSFNTMVTAVSSSMTKAASATNTAMNSLLNHIRNAGAKIQQTGSTAGKNFSTAITNGIRSGVSSASNAASQLVNRVKAIVSGGQGGMHWAGSMLTHGVAAGMESALWRVANAANQIIQHAQRAARAAANINSPSRLFRDTVGMSISEGVAAGIDKGLFFVEDSAVNMIDTAASIVDDTKQTIMDVMDEIFKPQEEEPYKPLIQPIVDSAEYDTFMSNIDDIKMTTSRLTPDVDRYVRMGGNDSGTTDNSTHTNNTYSINVDVHGSNVNANELAREIERRIKDRQDRFDWSTGNEVFS